MTHKTDGFYTTMRRMKCMNTAFVVSASSLLFLCQHCTTAYNFRFWRGTDEHDRNEDSVTAGHQSKPVYAFRLLDPFWDLLSFNDEQKRQLLETALAMDDVQPHVDWEALRDQYVLATFDQQRRLNRRKPRTRRKRRGPKSVSSQVQSDLMDAISEMSSTGGKKEGSSNKGKKEGNTVANKSTPKGKAKDSTAAFGASLTLDNNPPTPDNNGPEDRQTNDDVLGLDDDIVGINDNNTGGSTDDKPVGDVVMLPVYNYTKGNCPDSGDSPSAVPCAPDNLEEICDKYDDEGSFRKCFEACMPSFCCIHDAPRNTNPIAPNCNTDVNCVQYAYCYIVWWKLHDTIGPATFLRLEQNDDFFDIQASEIQSDVTGQKFFNELLFHHFDDAGEIIRLGTVRINETLSVFSSDLIFLNETYWNTTI